MPNDSFFAALHAFHRGAQGGPEALDLGDGARWDTRLLPLSSLPPSVFFPRQAFVPDSTVKELVSESALRSPLLEIKQIEITAGALAWIWRLIESQIRV